VRLERIGLRRGYNSAIYRVILEDGTTFAIKITDHEEDAVLNMLHNRELEFYEWLDGVRREKHCDHQALSHLLKYSGGTRCDDEPGVLIFNDLSNHVGTQPNYSIGYDPYVVFQIVKQIAGYQSVYLSTDKEVSMGKELIKYHCTAKRSLAKLKKLSWISDEEKQCLREWTLPQNLFDLHTKIPEGIEGISGVLAHCDLWNGNLLFEEKEGTTHLLAILDWQTFKIGNPLLDVATIIGKNMATEDRREYTDAILNLYLHQIGKQKTKFKKKFEITREKVEILLSHALKWSCIQTMYAITLNPIDDIKEEGAEMGRLSIRLRELLNDVNG
ncbi:hypothetical protein PMAYCL1PPCAC_29764, partial [Pristionchus mayeri]